ncbi:MAG: SLBB domain-containing protein, partial [Candidatus Marinimicrobia bacterium]|nr:SLBB domain-containing protein [Candidatus Neomarinimicrobiota bacterium]
LQLFFIGLVLGQSATDIRQLKKQYESALQNQSKLILPSDVMEDDEIDGDLPTKQDLELMQTELEEKEKNEAIQLKHFGYDFFTMRDTLSIWNNLPVPPNYILGPGDEIIISLWGETQLRDNYTIGREGMVYVERVGQLSLTGKSMEQAKKYLEKQFQKVYETLKGSRPSTYMDVSLGQLKSINVTFVGEVKSPGIYPVHPFSTVLTGLIQAGGVDTTGSLRNIQIIRPVTDPQQVDMYAFLLSGETGQANMRLQDNDVIFIPPRSSRIEVVGAVKRPGIYEANRSGNVAAVVNYAGGLRTNAQHTLVVYRKNLGLLNRGAENTADVVYVPYTTADHMKIDNVNRIMALSAPDYIKSVYIYGQVKNSGSYGFQEGMSVLDLLKMVGGLFDETYYKTIYAPRAEIIRRDTKSNFPKVISFNLEELKQGNQTQNIELHNWDIILVRKNKNFAKSKQVQITGEVNVPGFYMLTKPKETLQELLNRSGGFTDRAFEDGIQLYRDSIQVALDNYNFSLAHGDSIHVPDHPGVIQVMGEVYNPGYVQYDRGKGLNNYIEAAGGFTLDARKKYITIIYPNGDVKVKDSFIPPRVKEGSLIIVHQEEEKLPFDGTAFLKESASIAASMATIFFIIRSQSN